MGFIGCQAQAKGAGETEAGRRFRFTTGRERGSADPEGPIWVERGRRARGGLRDGPGFPFLRLQRPPTEVVRRLKRAARLQIWVRARSSRFGPICRCGLREEDKPDALLRPVLGAVYRCEPCTTGSTRSSRGRRAHICDSRRCLAGLALDEESPPASVPGGSGRSFFDN